MARRSARKIQLPFDLVSVARLSFVFLFLFAHLSLSIHGHTDLSADGKHAVATQSVAGSCADQQCDQNEGKDEQHCHICQASQQFVAGTADQPLLIAPNEHSSSFHSIESILSISSVSSSFGQRAPPAIV